MRFVGDMIAMVVAETPEQARDAAEAVDVDYDELPAVVSMEAAQAEGAPKLHDLDDNSCFSWGIGDAEATDAAFAKADHVTTLDLVNNRKCPNAIEPRAAIGEYDSAHDSYTLYTTSQNPHVIRLLMGAFVLGIPEHKLRVVSPDVGGGFGSKIPHYPEEIAVTWAGKQVGRPVKWTAERTESFLSDTHGRDHITRVELACTSDGEFLGLRVHTQANMGAYPVDLRAADPDVSLRDAAGGSLHHACDSLRRGWHFHQHGAGGRGTGRRPAGSPLSCWSGWWKPPRGNSGSTRSNFVAATSFRPMPCRTRLP